ncbi:MAG: Ig-like domain repeat protein, partial [Methanosphaera sp.]|nr:Ig-like domain repeat protein [Methanosphaera sp.]
VVTYEPISDVTLGENVTITGTFTDANGKAVTNSNVKITINGKKYYAKTDSTGKYTLSVATTKEGVNNVTIGYSGSAKYNAFETSTTFTVLKKA